MRYAATAALLLATIAGCAGTTNWAPPIGPPGTIVLSNPLFVPATDHEMVGETVADVMDDYFQIKEEIPVRVAGNVLTEGRLETFPLVGATLLEPWHGDSASSYERLESTLQSIRRTAVVRIIPAQGGFWLDVAVFKELENCAQPLMATTGPATFRYDTSLTRIVNPIGEQETNIGWIPKGRDPSLEQRLLNHLQWRFGGYGAPAPLLQ